MNMKRENNYEKNEKREREKKRMCMTRKRKGRD